MKYPSFPIKSVLKPSAQTTKLYPKPSNSNQLLLSANAYISKNISNNPILCSILELQVIYGLRISEVLNIRVYDINALSHIVIRGSKGSNNRIIVPLLSKSFFVNCKMNNLDPFLHVSRFYVYREYKKLGFSFVFNGQVNASVTHLFRSLLAVELSNNNTNLEDIKDFYGHKNIDNTRIYANKK